MAGCRLVSYWTPAGIRAGMVVDGEVVDAAAATGRDSDATMRGILNDWPAARARLARAATAGTKPVGAVATVELLAPVPDPGAVFCAGNNYADHVAEMEKARNRPPTPDPHTLGLHAWHFVTPPQCVAGPGDLRLPAGASKVDWEAELAAVIGIPARAVSVADALDHVAGYTIANDVSARDLSKRDGIVQTSPMWHDWISHKCFDDSLPLGPWLVPADEIPDPQALRISLTVNGVTKQDSSTAHMIYSLAEQISDLSRRLTLRPGDVICTGTPGGVGMGRNEFLKAGDIVVVRIEKIGELTNRFL